MATELVEAGTELATALSVLTIAALFFATTAGWMARWARRALDV